MNDLEIAGLVASELEKLGLPSARKKCQIQTGKVHWVGMADSQDGYVVRIRYTDLAIPRLHGQRLHPTTEHRLEKWSKRSNDEIREWCGTLAYDSLVLIERDFDRLHLEYPSDYPHLGSMLMYGPDRPVLVGKVSRE